MKISVKIFLLLFFILALSCSKEKDRVSIIEEKDLDKQMIEAYTDGLKELEKGERVHIPCRPYESDRGGKY